MTEPPGSAARPRDSASIDLGRRTVTGGYFLLRRGGPARTPFLPGIAPGASTGPDAAADDMAAGELYRHCFTYAGGGSTIRDELIGMIDGARRKIFIAVLVLGDKDLREALIRAAGRLRGGVYVVSALDNKGLEQAINQYDDDSDIDAQLEHRNFRELTRYGIYVRGYRGLHAKFAVIDDKVALVSSANMVSRSFTTTGENGVVVTSQPDVAVLARVFTRLWQLSEWDMPPDARHLGVVDRRAAATDVPEPPAAVEGRGPVWTWEQDEAGHHIARTIVGVIDSAREDLILATFSIAGISYPLPGVRVRPELLLEPVQRAARGARVRLLLRGRNFLPAARAEATAFAEAGAEVVPDGGNHAKGVIADRERGALFSANFTVPRGLTGGVEMGMRLDGTAALAEAHRYFEHVMAEASMEFARDPLLGDLAERLFADAMTRWPLPRTLPVIATDGDWDALAAGQGVVAYELEGDGTVTLYSGRRCWTLRQVVGPWYLTRKDEGRQGAADLFESWLTGKNLDKVRRGLCPATLVRAEPPGSGGLPPRRSAVGPDASPE